MTAVETPGPKDPSPRDRPDRGADAARYDQKAAEIAWGRATDFFTEDLQ